MTKVSDLAWRALRLEDIDQDLSVRTANCLLNASCTTLGEAVDRFVIRGEPFRKAHRGERTMPTVGTPLAPLAFSRPACFRLSRQGADTGPRGCEAPPFVSLPRYSSVRWTRLGRAGTEREAESGTVVRRPLAERVERFWATFTPEPNTGCWLWTGAQNNDGYGKVGWEGKWLSTHRLAFVLSGNEIPEDKIILHSCDVRCCGNPRHLRAGTYADNVQDAISRGRHVGGNIPKGKRSERVMVCNVLVSPDCARRLRERGPTVYRAVRAVLEEWSAAQQAARGTP